ncbi:hypothetical protein Tco_0109720 [Tanacetum coccineum]
MYLSSSMANNKFLKLHLVSLQLFLHHLRSLILLNNKQHQPPFFNPLLQQQTPTSITTTSTNPTVTLLEIPNFASVFKFNQRVSAFKSEMSKFRQTNQFAEAVSSILGTVDMYLASKMKEAVDVAVQLQKKQAQRRSSSRESRISQSAASLSEFELKKILIDKIEANKSIDRSDIQKNLYNALVESYNNDNDIITSYGDVVILKKGRDDQDKDEDPSAGLDRGTKRRKSGKDDKSSKDSSKSAHVEEPSHTVEDSGMQQDQEFVMGDNDEQPADKEVTKADWFKKLERPPTPNPNWSKRQQVDFRPPQTWISQVAHAKEPPTSFDELNDTSFDFFAFVMNRLKIPNLTQEILVGPTFNLLKGTCMSITELEYHLEECSKATTERLVWHNPENKPPVVVKYDQHAYLGTSYRGPKRQSFYGYTSNLTSSKDVYSRRRIIVVTILKIMKKYDYGHLEEIKVHRDDQQLYTFKEGDFKRLRLQDIEDMLLLLVQQKLTNLTIDEWYDLNVALRKRMEYLPMRKWSNLDKKRAWVMLQDIDKQLYQRRLMRNLEKFVGGREYGNDLSLMERTI